MLTLKFKLKSVFAQTFDRIANLILGPLARVTRLAADHDMCLLLRAEIARCGVGAQPAPVAVL
jgi:hypothetical protein